MSTKMSKLSFRAKPLDASKPMPVYINEDLPGLPDYSAINRAVPQMPSGMYEEEECEHHLQRAICTGLIIPTPEFTDVSDGLTYDRLYPPNFKTPRQLVHMQSFAMDQDIPDYDMDSEDELWFSSQKSKLEITPLKFEEMMDRLEKGSVQTVLSEQQAKALLKDDDDIILAVYEYWLNKRLKTQHPLIPSVRTEHHSGTASNNPYIAFRRRTEKMQTRKHRKNDETSYEKMLKLKRDLSRAVTLLEMIKRREKTKREVLHLTVEVFEKRFQAADFSGQLLAEVSAVPKTPRPAFAPLFPNQFSVNHQNWPPKDEPIPRKEKRQYKKRKHKVALAIAGGVGSSANMGRRTSFSTGHLSANAAAAAAAAAAELTAAIGGESLEMDGLSSDEGEASTALLSGAAGSEDEESGLETTDGQFAFRRLKDINYHAPLPEGQGNWPWCSREEGGLADRRYRYCLTSLATPPPGRCVGFARRRVGRGGRVVLDRAHTAMDDVFRSLDFTIFDSKDKQKVQQKSLQKQSQSRTVLNDKPLLKRQQTSQLSADDVRTALHRSRSQITGHSETMSELPAIKQRRLEHSYHEEHPASEIHHRQKFEIPHQDTRDMVRDRHAQVSSVKEPSSWNQLLQEDRQRYRSGAQTNLYQPRLPQGDTRHRSQEHVHHDVRTHMHHRSSEEQPSLQRPRYYSSVQNSRDNMPHQEERKPQTQGPREDRENFLSQIREWLHFRPETRSGVDLNALRFDVDAPNSGNPTELRVTDILNNIPGFSDASNRTSTNRRRPDAFDLNREDPAIPMIRRTAPPQATSSGHCGGSFCGPRQYEHHSPQYDNCVGCSYFNIYPGSCAQITTSHQMWPTISINHHGSTLTINNCANHCGGAGSITCTIRCTCATRSYATRCSCAYRCTCAYHCSSAYRSNCGSRTHQHRKQEHHHRQHQQSYSVYHASGNRTPVNPQPLSNGVSLIPVSMSAVLSANPGLLRQGLSNGPAIPAVGSHASRRRHIPVYIKQEVVEEPMDGPHETYNCVSYGGGAGPSPAEASASSLRVSSATGDSGTTATVACGERQKLKSSTASQHVLMEVT